MNEKWRTYWTSDTTNETNDYNIVSIEKNTTLIYIDTTSMKVNSKIAWKSSMTFMNVIQTSQDKNQLKKDWLNCSNENIARWRRRVMLWSCTSS